ncbi:DUF2510 domain-containing protein [Streptomyces sp. NPDC058171]
MTTQVPAGWHPDPTDPNLIRYWDGTQWTADVQQKPPPAPTPVAVAVNAYETIRKVLTALAFASLLLFGFLLFAGVRADGTNCGSPASPKLTQLVGMGGDFWACREAIDTRSTWAWIALGTCVILLVVAVIVGKAGQKLERR